MAAIDLLPPPSCDGEPLWQWLPQETRRARIACLDYVRMGPGRSLVKLLDRYRIGTGSVPEKPPSTRRTTLCTWSTDFGWQARASAFDADDQERARRQWEERRQAMREADWKQGDALRNLAQRILDEAPKFIKHRETTLADGRVVVTLQLDADLAIKALQAGSKLQRLATDEPTDTLQLSGAALDGIIARELARLADDA